MKKLIGTIFLMLTISVSMAQETQYGNNPEAGKYVQSGTAKIYYEVYGSGNALLLLHGDTFGYISELEEYIPLLAKHFKVIAVGMRGHGKSEIGTEKFSYKLFAQDAVNVLKNEGQDTAMVMGFSAGAIIAYYLAANHSRNITKAVAIAGIVDTTGYMPHIVKWKKNLTEAECMKILPDVVKSRKALMPEPDSYQKLLNKLKEAWLQPTYVERAKLASIKLPVLTIAGDRDDYFKTEALVKIYKLIPGSQLCILPDRNHVQMIWDTAMLNNIVIPFLQQK